MNKTKEHECVEIKQAIIRAYSQQNEPGKVVKDHIKFCEQCRLYKILMREEWILN